MIAHTIKGAAVNVGLKSLGRRAKIIERFCDSILEGKSQEMVRIVGSKFPYASCSVSYFDLQLNAKADPYIVLIKEEYDKIQQFKNERLE